ncbi:MAG: radical SAM protein, partial [Methanomicrobiales archaeon]|nr:radical SAM protein [Methanomicrobiales archaeon]
MTGKSSSPYVVTASAASYDLLKDKTPLLGHLDMELTERCNNDCIHCCINLSEHDQAQERELSTADVKRILGEAAALGALSVRFTGGEPLLRSDFSGIYLFARNLGLSVLLFTNARLITPKVAEMLSRIPPREPIEVSVYGMTQKSYEAVTRVKGSFDEFRRGIGLLEEKKIPFVVKSALLPQNRDEVLQFEAWASSLPAMTSPPSYALFYDLRCRRDSPQKNELIRRLRVTPEQAIAFLSSDREAYCRGMEMFCSRFMRAPGDTLFDCGAGCGCCVDAYGKLQPCLQLRHPQTTYDLKAGSLKDALIRFFPELRTMKATSPDYLSRCARCFLKGLCEQCPAKSWMEHGTLDTPV